MKKKLFYLLPAALFVLCSLSTSNVMAQGINVCDLYGSVYVESSESFADYAVYVEDSEIYADLVVYEEENELYADRSGIWYFTSASNFAKFTVYFVDSRNYADFTIYYTSSSNFAGCQ